VYAPADITSTALGVYLKSWRKLVIVLPSSKRESSRILARNSRFVGGPLIEDWVRSVFIEEIVSSLDGE
jgi:hypothetical protein